MHKLWLLFAQTTTICLAVLFVVGLVNPEWTPWRPSRVVSVQQVATADAPSDSAFKGASFRAAAAAAMPSVVNIFSTKERGGSPLGDSTSPRLPFAPLPQAGLGSGVIVSTQGYILTNHHVVDAAEEISVALADGRTFPAHVVGADPESDLAVVRVEAEHLRAITFGNSDQLRIGDIVLAIGNPFGVGQTVTMGIVSALGRSHLGVNTFENFIQTDAAVNPGNSGGALVDTSGNLVGINSLIYSKTGANEGIAFTIPVSLAKHVMEDIIRHGAVVRGWIGVEVQDVTPEIAESFRLSKTSGALIAGVIRGGPADRAGVRPGDVLVEIAGKPVKDVTSMLNTVADLEPDSKATARLLREKDSLEIELTIGKRPTQRRQ